MKLRELEVRYKPTDPALTITRAAINQSVQAARILVPLLKDQAQEVAIALLLDTQHRPISIVELGRGPMDAVSMDPRVLFRAALLASATRIILGHNHPSGEATPSQADIEVTRKLQAAGKLMEIEILDHLIVGDGNYCSLMDTGRMRE